MIQPGQITKCDEILLPLSIVSEMPQDKKLGFDFYRSLGSPVNVVAPMVDASELAWRMLGRKYGAELCFTPMFHSGRIYRDL